MGDALDLGPFGVGHEGGPGGGLGGLVRPFQQIDEFGALAEPRFPHRDDLEAVPVAHDAGGVIRKRA